MSLWSHKQVQFPVPQEARPMWNYPRKQVLADRWAVGCRREQLFLNYSGLESLKQHLSCRATSPGCGPCSTGAGPCTSAPSSEVLCRLMRSTWTQPRPPASAPGLPVWCHLNTFRLIPHIRKGAVTTSLGNNSPTRKAALGPSRPEFTWPCRPIQLPRVLPQL